MGPKEKLKFTEKYEAAWKVLLGFSGTVAFFLVLGAQDFNSEDYSVLDEDLKRDLEDYENQYSTICLSLSENKKAELKQTVSNRNKAAAAGGFNYTGQWSCDLEEGGQGFYVWKASFQKRVKPL